MGLPSAAAELAAAAAASSLLLLLLLLSSSRSVSAAVLPASSFPAAAGGKSIATTTFRAPAGATAATNISYDGRSLLLNGRRRLFVSGGVHYARHQPKLWRPVLEQARAAGLVGITSYVMWNQHESLRGTYDWGQVQPRSNISAFLQVAHDVGLYVHLRLGPYIDGEWNYGGYPWWVNDIANITSGDNRAYQVEMQRWITTLVNKIRPFLASNGGPVIMLQIENEFSDQSSEGKRYAEWAMAMATSLDTGIPWTFCNNSGSATYPQLPNVIFTANAGMGPESMIIEKLCGVPPIGETMQYRNMPCLWTEIEESFYTFPSQNNGGQWAGGLADMQLRWYSLGGAGSNYYMWAGGTDYSLSAGDDDTTSYHQYSCLEPVFDKPNEPKYSFLAKLHRLLVEHEDLLLSQDPPPPQVLVDMDMLSANTLQLRTYKNASMSLHFIANLGDHGSTAQIPDDRSKQRWFLARHSHLLISESLGNATASAGTLHLLFNSSDVEPNNNPPFTVRNATMAALNWSFFEEGSPSQYAPMLVTAAGLQTLRTKSDTPGEQVALELQLAHTQVSDYAWYSIDYHPIVSHGNWSFDGIVPNLSSGIQHDQEALELSPAQTIVASPPPSPPSIDVFACAPGASWQTWTLISVAKWSKRVAIQWSHDPTLCVSSTPQYLDGGNGTSLAPCSLSDPRQQWLMGVGAAGGSDHIEGSNGDCLDVQDANVSDGANVMVYQCSPRPGGNQRWQVKHHDTPSHHQSSRTASTAQHVSIVTLLDQKCLGSCPAGGCPKAPAHDMISAVLHESTLSYVFLNGSRVDGVLDNQGHNGHDAQPNPIVLPNSTLRGGVTKVEALSSTMGISADIASASIALAKGVEYLGLKSLTVGNDTLSGTWTMQVGLLGEALHLPTHAGAAKVTWTKLTWSEIPTRPVAPLTWLKATFDAPLDWDEDGAEALALDLTGAGKGHVYLNGFDCGRYWVRDPVLSTYYQLPPDNLRRAKNLLVLFEEVGIMPGGVATIRVVRRA
jgi:hypothetical protein